MFLKKQVELLLVLGTVLGAIMQGVFLIDALSYFAALIADFAELKMADIIKILLKF